MVLSSIGILVLIGIILMAVYVTLGGWLFAEPRDFRTAAVGIGYMALITVAMIGATAGLGVAFWFIANLPL